jgi:nitroreductase
MLGWFDEKAVKKLLDIPNSRHIGLIISLGYPKNEDNKTKNRKKIEEIHSFNSYKKEKE